ncbi:MAG: NfeD family protein, partial [Desulfonatronovibrio sp.]
LSFAGALSLDTRLVFRKIKVPLVYALLQVPGYFFLGIILGFAFERNWISGFTVWAVILAWAAKDVLLYPLYRNALNPGSQNIIARLYGSTAIVRVALDPVGQVALRGEIWQARSLDRDVIDPGTKVVVKGNKGLTLEVARKEEQEAGFNAQDKRFK